jgi:hypothetical protein
MRPMVKKISDVIDGPVQSPGGRWRRLFTFDLHPGTVQGKTRGDIMNENLQTVNCVAMDTFTILHTCYSIRLFEMS